MKHSIPEWWGSFLSYNWIVPRVGLVKIDLHRMFSLPPTIYREEHWELFWYNLVE